MTGWEMIDKNRPVIPTFVGTGSSPVRTARCRLEYTIQKKTVFKRKTIFMFVFRFEVKISLSLSQNFLKCSI